MFRLSIHHKLKCLLVMKATSSGICSKYVQKKTQKYVWPIPSVPRFYPIPNWESEPPPQFHSFKESGTRKRRFQSRLRQNTRFWRMWISTGIAVKVNACRQWKNKAVYTACSTACKLNSIIITAFAVETWNSFASGLNEVWIDRMFYNCL